MDTTPTGPQTDLFGINIIQQFQARPLEFLDELKTYGDLVYTKIGTQDSYFVFDPALVQKILIHDYRSYRKPTSLVQPLERVIGKSLITSDGLDWEQQRGHFQPGFHHTYLKTYADSMIRYAEDMRRSWRIGSIIDLETELRSLTMRTIIRTLFGDTTADSIPHLSSPDQVVARLLEATVNADDDLLEAVRALIQAQIQSRSAADTSFMHFLIPLLENGQISEQQIVNEAVSLYIAGYETTASALAWVFYFVATNPTVDQTLSTELLNHVEDEITFEDLHHLPYTGNIVKEVLRLRPAAWITGRETITEIELGGTKLNPGSMVYISPYALHLDPRNFHNPTEFNPQRFAADYAHTHNSQAYIPFGLGPRVCIGNGYTIMQAKLVLAALMRDLRFEVVQGNHENTVAGEVLSMKDPLRVKVHSR